MKKLFLLAALIVGCTGPKIASEGAHRKIASGDSGGGAKLIKYFGNDISFLDIQLDSRDRMKLWMELSKDVDLKPYVQLKYGTKPDMLVDWKMARFATCNFQAKFMGFDFTQTQIEPFVPGPVEIYSTRTGETFASGRLEMQRTEKGKLKFIIGNIVSNDGVSTHVPMKRGDVRRTVILPGQKEQPWGMPSHIILEENVGYGSDLYGVYDGNSGDCKLSANYAREDVVKHLMEIQSKTAPQLNSIGPAVQSLDINSQNMTLFLNREIFGCKFIQGELPIDGLLSGNIAVTTNGGNKAYCNLTRGLQLKTESLTAAFDLKNDGVRLGLGIFSVPDRNNAYEFIPGIFGWNRFDTYSRQGKIAVDNIYTKRPSNCGIPPIRFGVGARLLPTGEIVKGGFIASEDIVRNGQTIVHKNQHFWLDQDQSNRVILYAVELDRMKSLGNVLATIPQVCDVNAKDEYLKSDYQTEFGGNHGQFSNWEGRCLDYIKAYPCEQQ
jgi:hypothetical protein